jgi:cob(I)alamin adenosyltransferase
LDELATDPEGTNTPLDWAKRDGYQAGLNGSFGFGRHEVVLDLDYRNKQQQSNFDYGFAADYREAALDMWSFSPRVRVPFETGGISHSLVLGVDLQRWDYRLHTSNGEVNIGTPINRVTADQNSAGLYTRDEMQLDSATRLTLGARYEWFEIDAHDRFDPAAPGSLFGSGASPDSKDDTQYAWELGLNHRLNPQHALFARAARSFRFATVDEIYEGYPHEFQFLKPQTSQDAQAGWEWGRGAKRMRSAAYYMRVKDEIHLDPYTFDNTNLPPLERYGLELEANSRLSSVDVRAAYTLAYAKFTGGSLNGVELDGKDVPLVPRNTLSLGMARKKAVVDAAIAAASDERGLLLVITGNGKGKSTSAFGMVARALGHGMKVGVVQFIKSRTDTGEEAFLGTHAEWHVTGDGFTWDTQNREQDIATAERGWAIAARMLADPSYQLVVLDELTYLLSYGYLDADRVLDALAHRPAMQHVVVTGRAATDALIELADTVSVIADEKHAFRAGVKAQPGIDL